MYPFTDEPLSPFSREEDLTPEQQFQLNQTVPTLQEPAVSSQPRNPNLGFKALDVLGFINQATDPANSRQSKIRMQQRQNTDAQQPMNPLNPFGNYTLNAGVGNNFQPTQQNSTQRFGYEQGGQTQLLPKGYHPSAESVGTCRTHPAMARPIYKDEQLQAFARKYDHDVSDNYQTALAAGSLVTGGGLGAAMSAVNFGLDAYAGYQSGDIQDWNSGQAATDAIGMMAGNTRVGKAAKLSGLIMDGTQALFGSPTTHKPAHKMAEGGQTDPPNKTRQYLQQMQPDDPGQQPFWREAISDIPHPLQPGQQVTYGQLQQLMQGGSRKQILDAYGKAQRVDNPTAEDFLRKQFEQGQHRLFERAQQVPDAYAFPASADQAHQQALAPLRQAAAQRIQPDNPQQVTNERIRAQYYAGLGPNVAGYSAPGVSQKPHRFTQGGEYQLSSWEVQELRNQGYQIEELD